MRALTQEQRETRRRMGCDRECGEGQEQYAITCTYCNGTGCHRCDRGRLPVRRCPMSQMTPEIVLAMDAMSWTKHGTMPAMGGWGDQSPSFLEFCRVFENEVAAVRAEEEEERQAKARRRPRMKGRA